MSWTDFSCSLRTLWNVSMILWSGPAALSTLSTKLSEWVETGVCRERKMAVCERVILIVAAMDEIKFAWEVQPKFFRLICAPSQLVTYVLASMLIKGHFKNSPSQQCPLQLHIINSWRLCEIFWLCYVKLYTSWSSVYILSFLHCSLNGQKVFFLRSESLLYDSRGISGNSN